MTTRLATYAAIIALSAATTVAARAATATDPAQDQSENQVTAQLNQQQLQSNKGFAIYRGASWNQQGAMQEQIAQPPSDAGDLSIIE